MSYLNANGIEIYYEDKGNVARPAVVFSHGLLWSCRMFDEQVDALQNDYRTIAYDHRGQGNSQPLTDAYDMETVYADAVALIETLGIAPCFFVGLSMGGFVGMRLAARRPDLVRGLVLLETSAEPEPTENIPRYRMLNNIVKYIGYWPVWNSVKKIMFGQKFLNDSTRRELLKACEKAFKSNHRKGITKAVEGVINRRGVLDELKNIKCPTLIIVGDQDVATVPEKSKTIQKNIACSKLVIIPGAGHSSSIEEPEAVTKAIIAFLKQYG
ncbi:MAG: alpha/beta fold hydrolase [Runella sp.]